MLLLALLIGVVFWLDLAKLPCDIPITYRLGVVDERFNLERSEIKNIVEEATAVWEDAIGADLFVYDDSGELVINFIFDERQQTVVSGENIKDKLDESEQINESFQTTYEQLLEKYNSLLELYNIRLGNFEKARDAYSKEVERYNAAGGAPPDVYEDLDKERDRLDKEADSLNEESQTLNELVKRLNSLSDKGNKLIEIYNQNVNKYNGVFGESSEFTQGDYQSGVINIYSFIDDWELRTVLAHELGHALSLNHVENNQSIMYYLIGDQPSSTSLSAEDTNEYHNVCVEGQEWWYKFVTWL